MASYHCTVKAGAPASAAAHDAYIERTGKYETKRGGDDLEHAESGNLPSWAEDSAHFWRESDARERINAAGYREHELALPRELTPAQRLELVREWVAQELGDRHAYSFAIHNPRAAFEGGEQPHAHLMYSERVHDGIERDTPAHFFKRADSKQPERGGCAKAGSARKSAAERRADLVALRERWADLQNRHLERAGHAERVDHRTLQAQGIDRQPDGHIGPRAAAALQRGTAGQQIREWAEAQAIRRELVQLPDLERQIDADRAELEQVRQLAEAATERGAGTALRASWQAEGEPLGGVELVAEKIAPEPSQGAPGADPVGEVAAYMDAMRIRIERTTQEASRQVQTQTEAAAAYRARQDQARAQLAALKEPGWFASRATKERHTADLAEVMKRGQAAVDAEHRARGLIAEAREVLASPQAAARAAAAAIRRDNPQQVARVSQLLRERPELQQLAAQRLREQAARPAAERPQQVRERSRDHGPDLGR